MNVPTTVACHACGTALLAGAPYCGACGSPRRAGTGTPEPMVVAAPAPAPSAVSPAAPGRRLAAFVVDQAAALLVCVAAVAGVGALTGSATTSGTVTLVAVPAACVLAFGLGQLLWEGRSGRTIGNVSLRVRTVAVPTGGAPGLGRAFLRRVVEALGSVVVLGTYVVVLSPAWDRGPHRQGWQDKLAGTTMLDAQQRAVAGSAGLLEAVSAPAIPVPPAPVPAMSAPSAPSIPVPSAPVVASPRSAGALISDVPGFAADPAEPVAATPPSHPPVPATFPVPETVRAEPAAAERELDRTRLRDAVSAPIPSSGYHLELDNGEVMPVSGTGLVGRNPAPLAGEEVEHLVPLADEARSISKTHLKFGVGDEGFWVLDRGSTNGTFTVSPEGARVEVPRGVRIAVPVNSAVEIGDRRFVVRAG